MMFEGVNYGPMNHEKLGADFLRSFKIAESVCELVEKHVSAKRYFVFKVNFKSSFVNKKIRKIYLVFSLIFKNWSSSYLNYFYCLIPKGTRVL